MGSKTIPRSPAFPPVVTRDNLREIARMGCGHRPDISEHPGHLMFRESLKLQMHAVARVGPHIQHMPIGKQQVLPFDARQGTGEGRRGV